MLALLGSAVLVQRRALDAAADPQEDVARGAAGEEDGVRRDRGLPRLQGAGAARELSVGFAGHAGAVEPLLVVGRLPVVEAHRRAARCPQSMVDRAPEVPVDDLDPDEDRRFGLKPAEVVVGARDEEVGLRRGGDKACAQEGSVRLWRAATLESCRCDALSEGE